MGRQSERKAGAEESPIVDSALDFAAAVSGTAAPVEILADLTLVTVHYRGFDRRRHEGQLLIHRDLTMEIKEIFALLEKRQFPISHCIPVARYGWSDEASMAADNSSSFNYRRIAGTARLSLHARGLAVDINPFRNPVLFPNGQRAPEAAVYRPGAPGVFADGDAVLGIFLERGWRWGGHFTHCRDYHHFERSGQGSAGQCRRPFTAEG